jgi:hypothetical protein
MPGPKSLKVLEQRGVTSTLSVLRGLSLTKPAFDDLLATDASLIDLWLRRIAPFGMNVGHEASCLERVDDF